MESTNPQLEYLLRGQQTVLMVAEGCISLLGPRRHEHDSQTTDHYEEKDTWCGCSLTCPDNTEDLNRFTSIRYLLEPKWLKLCSCGQGPAGLRLPSTNLR